MRKTMISAIALISALAVFILPELSMAAATTSAFAGSTLNKVVAGFFTIPLVRGVIMTGTIGGGLYLVLSGFGIIGQGGTDPKKIVLGGILTGIGFSYNSLSKKIASTFV